jgi:hypothetical protein
MVANLTRFYYDFDEDCRTGCFVNLSFEDIETTEADLFEAKLRERGVNYTRIDL